jgi:L-fuculose-phosphate aldolase
VVTYADDIEKALWMTEILDAACKTVILANQVGGPKILSKQQSKALVEARARYGFTDPRDLSDPASDVRDHLLFGKP